MQKQATILFYLDAMADALSMIAFLISFLALQLAAFSSPVSAHGICKKATVCIFLFLSVLPES